MSRDGVRKDCFLYPCSHGRCWRSFPVPGRFSRMSEGWLKSDLPGTSADGPDAVGRLPLLDPLGTASARSSPGARPLASAGSHAISTRKPRLHPRLDGQRGPAMRRDALDLGCGWLFSKYSRRIPCACLGVTREVAVTNHAGGLAAFHGVLSEMGDQPSTVLEPMPSRNAANAAMTRQADGHEDANLRPVSARKPASACRRRPKSRQ